MFDFPISSLEKTILSSLNCFYVFQIPIGSSIGNIYMGLGDLCWVGDSVLCSIEICPCPFDIVTL